MQNGLKLFTPIVASLMALPVSLTAITVFFDRQLFYICGLITCAVFIVVISMLLSLRKRAVGVLSELADGIQASMGGAFSHLPTPVITVMGGGEIIWYNELCAQNIFGGREMRGENISSVLADIDVWETSPPEGYDVKYGDHRYTAYVVAMTLEDGPCSVVYMVNDTKLKHFAREYRESKPSIALIAVDNFDELVQDYTDSERAQLMAQIEHSFEWYFSAHNGFVTKISRDKFIAVVEARGVRDIMTGRFDLLDKVKQIQNDHHRMPATLSIGLSGDSDNLYEAEQAAKQALDMCLGRGGDQAAVKTKNGYEFYGGVSKAVEKRSKVRTRIIANALSELIESSSNVILMGHRFADLDCLGSAVGMLKAVRAMGRPAVIAIDRERNLVAPLLEKLLASGYSEDDFVSPKDALGLVGSKTLLIITDVHIPQVLESEELYRNAPFVVVIDHHRKLVGHIDDAVIFYHEPFASSAAEMVAELVQYFPKGHGISRVEAEALMAGIMLDTKNFVMRTGVRTFEAAAWLRKLGADTIEVRKLFASSIESYQRKAALISAADIYRGCAIVTLSDPLDDIKLVAPQVADEMMTISGVSASFVIFSYENVISISARSMGLVNVQLIMEKLGGGGHHAMAAAQFKDAGIETVRDRLTEAIDSYWEEVSPSMAK